MATAQGTCRGDNRASARRLEKYKRAYHQAAYKEQQKERGSDPWDIRHARDAAAALREQIKPRAKRLYPDVGFGRAGAWIRVQSDVTKRFKIFDHYKC